MCNRIFCWKIFNNFRTSCAHRNRSIYDLVSYVGLLCNRKKNFISCIILFRKQIITFFSSSSSNASSKVYKMKKINERKIKTYQQHSSKWNNYVLAELISDIRIPFEWNVKFLTFLWDEDVTIRVYEKEFFYYFYFFQAKSSWKITPASLFWVHLICNVHSSVFLWCVAINRWSVV